MRTQQHRAPLAFAAALFGMLTMAAVPANAQYATYYVTMATDGPDMVVQGVTDTNYYMAGQHTAYATVTVTRPNGVRSSSSAFEADRVLLIMRMPINRHDGMWHAINEAKDFCPIAWKYTGFGTAYAEQAVNPFVKLVRAQFTPSAISRQSDNTTLSVDLMTSNNCSGTVVVTATLTKPPGMVITIDGQPETASDSVPLQLGDSKAASFPVHTGNNNMTGNVVATTYISDRPAACELKGPDCAGCTASPTLRVE